MVFPQEILQQVAVSVTSTFRRRTLNQKRGDVIQEVVRKGRRY